MFIKEGSMANNNKNSEIPLKQAEIAIRRFNDMAIPYHIGLLENHRNNIIKSLNMGDWQQLRKEEINATHVIKQVKNLLVEMDELRERVCDKDLEKFDSMMEEGKQKAYNGMKEYLELTLKSPYQSKLKGSALSRNDDDIDEQQKQFTNLPSPAEITQVQIYKNAIPEIESGYNPNAYVVQQRQACLDELENLQDEIRDLNGMFHDMHTIVHEQAESVQIIADNAEEALENIQMGESNLRKALKYKKAMYPVLGAVMGTCVGGPIGLLAGLKVGSLAAVGCGLLGYTGGTVLKTQNAITQGNIEESQCIENQSQHNENIEMHQTND